MDSRGERLWRANTTIRRPWRNSRTASASTRSKAMPRRSASFSWRSSAISARPRIWSTGCSSLRWTCCGTRARRRASEIAACGFASAQPQAVAFSGQQIANHVAVHVGQAEVAALEAIGQLLVVDAEAVQDRGVQVVDVHRLVLDVV